VGGRAERSEGQNETLSRAIDLEGVKALIQATKRAALAYCTRHELRDEERLKSYDNKSQIENV
jgi:hypothetical protein